jgi:hypothetical protein
MKTIKLMIIVLVAVLGFSSCSKESDSNKEKKLVKIYCEKKSNDKKYLYSNWTFEYNEEEQLVSAYNEIFSGEEDYIIGTYKYTWYKEAIDVVSDIKIKMSFVEDEEVTQNQKYTLILKDGRFSYGLGLGEEESTKSIYSYTSNGKMQNYKDIASDFICVWDGDKLIEVNNNDPVLRTDYKFTYGNISCVKGFALNAILTTQQAEHLSYVHPELAGIRTSQCPILEKITYYDGEQITDSTTYEYSYEFDEEGYMTKMTGIVIDKEETIDYALTWE